MKKVKSVTSHFIVLLSAILTITSCKTTSAVADKITIESGEIPPDMKTEKFILIGTLKDKRSYDKYVEKEFDAYTGEYVLATKEEISTKYPDKSKYRYIMDCVEVRSPSGNGKDYTTGFRYYIRDRKTGTNYTRKGQSSFFALEMKAYLKAIEAVRKQ